VKMRLTNLAMEVHARRLVSLGHLPQLEKSLDIKFVLIHKAFFGTIPNIK